VWLGVFFFFFLLAAKEAAPSVVGMSIKRLPRHRAQEEVTFCFFLYGWASERMDRHNPGIEKRVARLSGQFYLSLLLFILYGTLVVFLRWRCLPVGQ